jgi:hypothetical protein
MENTEEVPVLKSGSRKEITVFAYIMDKPGIAGKNKNFWRMNGSMAMFRNDIGRVASQVKKDFIGLQWIGRFIVRTTSYPLKILVT